MREAAKSVCAWMLASALLVPGAAAQGTEGGDAGQPPPAAPDADGDGIPDALESGDTDSDGVPDVYDVDDDGDGVRTQHELGDATDLPPDASVGARFLDTDGDLRFNHKDGDDDGDGIATRAEGSDPNGDGDPSDAVATADQTDSPFRIPDYLNADDDSDMFLTIDERPSGQDRDSDGDGRPDHRDDDDDDDGMPREGTDDTDGDGLPDQRDPDDDQDGVPSLTEDTPTRDTDHDGLLDPYDPDDDGDTVPTRAELGAGSAPRDTDGDEVPDFLDTDDDGDGLASVPELARGDTDGDGIGDALDADDDGDRIDTLIERAFVSDVDLDGLPNWYDLDADGDGLLDVDEGLGDDDGDGVPNFVDPTQGAGSGEGTGEQPGAPVDAGAPEAIDAGRTPTEPTTGLPTATSDDAGCTLAHSGWRDLPGWSLLWLVLVLALWRRRRATSLATIAAGSLAIAACGDDDRGGIWLGGDAGPPRPDAAVDAATDTGTPDDDAGPAPDDAGPGDPSLGSACTVEGDTLEASIEEPGERAFAALLQGGTVHVVYVVASCPGVGTASGTRIEHRSFGSTGAFGAAEVIAQDREGACRLRRSPALVANPNGVLTAYFTSNSEGAYELYRRELSATSTPAPVTTDAAGDPRDELDTVALALGDAPLLAYTVQTTLRGPKQLLTQRPARAGVEVVAAARMERPTRLALAPLPQVTGAVLAWVSELDASYAMRLQPLDLAGAPRGAPVDLSDQVGGLSSVALATSSAAAAVVYNVQTRSVAELRFRALDAQGVPGREVPLTAGNRSVSSVSAAPYAAGFALAFRDTPLTEGAATLRLMFVTSNGTIGGERTLRDVASSGGASQIFVFPDGRLAVTWVDYGAAGATLRAVRVRCF